MAMSKQRKKETAEIEARWKEFWDDHKDFDSAWARNVLHMTSESLPYIFGPDIADGLRELSVKNGVQFPPDFDWSSDWTGAFLPEYLPAAAIRQLQIFRLALALDAYAYYGLKLVDEDDRRDDFGLDQFLEVREIGLAPFPPEWGSDEDEQRISAALARQKLDYPEPRKGLPPDELAALARVSRKSIANLLAPGKGGLLQKDSDDRITVESAQRWLLSRPDFRPSIWQRQESKSSQRPPLSESSSIEPLFVPVATDGSWFSPSDCSEGENKDEEKVSWYCVANGGTEKAFKDYWKALEFVTQATSPRWRYTDSTGRSRIKTATRWERKARQEVEALLSPNAKKRQKGEKT
jgi:hypothetical protein